MKLLKLREDKGASAKEVRDMEQQLRERGPMNLKSNNNPHKKFANITEALLGAFKVRPTKSVLESYWPTKTGVECQTRWRHRCFDFGLSALATSSRWLAVLQVKTHNQQSQRATLPKGLSKHVDPASLAMVKKLALLVMQVCFDVSFRGYLEHGPPVLCDWEGDMSEMRSKATEHSFRNPCKPPAFLKLLKEMVFKKVVTTTSKTRVAWW